MLCDVVEPVTSEPPQELHSPPQQLQNQPSTSSADNNAPNADAVQHGAGAITVRDIPTFDALELRQLINLRDINIDNNPEQVPGIIRERLNTVINRAIEVSYPGSMLSIYGSNQAPFSNTGASERTGGCTSAAVGPFGGARETATASSQEDVLTPSVHQGCYECEERKKEKGQKQENRPAELTPRVNEYEMWASETASATRFLEHLNLSQLPDQSMLCDVVEPVTSEPPQELHSPPQQLQNQPSTSSADNNAPNADAVQHGAGAITVSDIPTFDALELRQLINFRDINIDNNPEQYTLSPEAVEGIAPVIQSLIDKGAIVECPQSPCNTPILPVKKPNGSWRPVQDLRAVNAAVHQVAPTVPNVITLVSQIPGDTRWYSVIDLANAYFSIPVHPDSQFWFAFTFNGKRYTWTRMPQGFSSSPTLFTVAVAENLAHWESPCGSTLVQYVDDLLICSPTKLACQTDTVSLLSFLTENGHKVSKDKLQLVSQSVRYLGHILTPEGRKLGPERIQAILDVPKPRNKKQMMSFLGLAGYCRPWIRNYAEISQPLNDITHGGKHLAMTDDLTWTLTAETAFTELKQALSSTPCLGLPDHTKPFNLFVS
ncbi:uncharacterized protein LOC113146384, partial [Mastacembelus armatus]|uniref:uncharacterized protein LOC113146384 n=1 Tax=Mastacembelus armatus TaxID=205130 RepID=UPI000E45ACED